MPGIWRKSKEPSVAGVKQAKRSGERDEVRGNTARSGFAIVMTLTLDEVEKDWRLLSRGGARSALFIYSFTNVLIILVCPGRRLRVGSWRQSDQPGS